MIASSDLHKLIKSLSQSEKRFFKIYASRHVIGEQNNYVALFDSIAEQKTYNEEALKKHFRKEPFVRRFAAVKNYLYLHVLKSMRSFHSGTTIDAELKDLLTDIDFLYQKGLYRQSKKLHSKAEKLANETDKKIRLLEILEWKAKLLQVDNKNPGLTNFHKMVFNEEDKILDSIRQSLEIKSEVLDVFALIRKQGFARSKEELRLIQQVIRKYEKLDYQLLDFNDKYYLNYIKTVYYTSSGDDKKAYVFTKRNVDLLESIPDKLREEEFERYIVSLNNLVVNLIHLQKTTEIHPYLKKIRSLATHNIRENVVLWVTSYKLVLGVIIRSGDYDQAEKIIGEIENGVAFYHDKIPPTDLVLFKYNMAIIYFIGKKYTTAVRLLNEIVNDSELSLRDDIQSYARLIRLIIFWEKGEQQLLSYATLSAYRYLYKRKKLFKFENLVLKFIKEKVPDMNTRAKQKLAFIELKNELEIIWKDPLERKVLEYFDFSTWIESKISKKDFKTLSREKHASGNV
ncbi:MAG: hypothetical protein M3R27_04705 [Bacteroidota bacterium]|nr:hypothetical protein [Bacteroidota bacterium]